jgi:hypothetical protein
MEMPPEPPPFDDLIVGDSGYSRSVPPQDVPAAGVSVAPAVSAPSSVTLEKKDLFQGSGQNRDSGNNSMASVNPEGWAGFVARLAGRDARLGSMLQRSQVHLTATGTLQLAVAAHALAVLNNESAKADILALWATFQGSSKAVKVELQPLATINGEAHKKDNVATPDNGASRRTLPGKEEIFNDPSVRFISERFGGRVTEIRKNY